jgi:hypothetical protein
MFVFKNWVMKIISQSPIQHLVRLQGILKETEKKYNRAPVFTDSISTVSVIRGLLRPEKKLEN